MFNANKLFILYLIPPLFKKKGYCNSLHLSVRLSIMLSPPKLLDGIQPNMVCEFFTLMGRVKAQFIWPCPLGPGKALTGQLQSQFQRFLYQFLRVFSQKRYKTYQNIYFFKHGHMTFQIDGDDEHTK